MKRVNEIALKTAKSEWKKESKEKKIYFIFILLFLISLFLFAVILSLNIIELSGYASSVLSRGGYITNVHIVGKIPVTIWGGFYGLVLRVPGFTQMLYKDLPYGGIERSDVFFDCVKTDATGGPEVFASTSPSLNLLDTSSIVPATNDMIDSWINCFTEEYCANKTFIKNMTIYLGSTRISNIPSTHTYKYDGQNEVFDIGALNVSGVLVFVSHVNATIQKGFNPEVFVNYQMLLPVPVNTTQRYYFYSDPNDGCPAGGIGNSIYAVIYGFIFDENGEYIQNATITVAGYSENSNVSGFYNLSTEVLTGTYSFVVQKQGYIPHVSNITFNSTSSAVYKNATLFLEKTGGGEQILSYNVFGHVKDIGGNAISGVNVSLGNSTGVTNSLGYYQIYPTLAIGTNPLIAIKQDYDNYYALLNFNSIDLIVNHNITMELANLNTYPVGPYSETAVDDVVGDQTEIVKEIVEEAGQDYWVSTTEINKQVRENTFIEDSISIYNFKSGVMQLVFSISPELEEIIKLDKTAMSVSPNSFDKLILTIYGTKPIGTYRGKLIISGDLSVEIPIKIEIVPKKLPIETLDMNIELFKERIGVGGKLKYRLNLKNLLSEQGYQIALKHLVLDSNGSKIFAEEEEEVEIKNSLSLLKEIDLSKNLSEGEYLVRVEARYLDFYSSVGAPFYIYKPIYLYSFFGMPLWIIFIITSVLSFALLNLFLYKRHLQKKKRYHLALNLDTLPKPGERSVKLGRIAEKNVNAYYNLDDLTTHAIVAGATGGGKSICAQVFVEEALLKGIAVVVFDPTAQWSGMLRKCEDKKMLSFFPKFGLKANDAKAFPGSVRQVKNYLESIDIKKYMTPGQIQIFTLNKLEPSQIDIFIAGVISNIFKSDPKEYPGLKVMLVFDEVHRLLPKFGGSGKGFLQIERACREFRKWGFGVMLVSQVLSDFVGEIKANINTEVQMRVAEENDLERIKERYGLDALKALVRADVGTGMVQNAEYNRGLPYFINFRPILHNTRRLTDEILDKYNQYSEVIDDLEYQIEQLEQEKIDTFDLKMELKLVKDKLMTGNFTVVDIYLEGLKPRIEKQWESIGKKPKKKEIKLINVDELQSSLAQAQKERKKWEDKEKKDEGVKEEKKEDKSAKIVRPITFDNGIMISSLNELKDVLPTLDNRVFKMQVNEEKNEIAEWVIKEVDSGLGEELKSAKDRKIMLEKIMNFIKTEKEKKEKEKTV